MIDSIEIYIHNITSKPDIVNKIRLRSQKQGIKILNVDNPHQDSVDPETGEIDTSKDDFLKIRQIEFEDTGKKIVSYSNKILTSSHYYLAYRIDTVRDRIEFNFSIPKYLYGTNLIQYVPHDIPEDQVEKFASLTYIKQITYDRLLSFINYFKERLFGDIPIDPKDIEIRRIDIAFNQIFQSKEDALKYLDYQKRIRKKYISENTKNKHDWNTSVFIVTDAYSAKIYHKGTEYKSSNGERNHHLKINRKLKHEVFPVEDKRDTEGKLVAEGLQSFADRILRYEMTFRNEYLSYVYKNQIFARFCPYFLAMKINYKEVRAVMRRCENKAKLDENKENIDIQDHYKEYDELPYNKRMDHIICEKILRKRNSFRLEITEDEKERNSTIKNVTTNRLKEPNIPTNAFFSKELLDTLFDIFLDFKEQFTLKSTDKLTDIGKRVAKYNRMVNELNKANEKNKKPLSRINQNRINMILMLLQNNTLDELIREQVISRRSKYNYINMLKKVGVEKNTVFQDHIEIPCSNDFTDYYKILYDKGFRYKKYTEAEYR